MYLYSVCRHMVLLFVCALGAYASIGCMHNDNTTNSIHPIILFSRDVTVGIVAAITECTVSHPLTTIKYRSQLGEKFRHMNFNPRFLYTGFGLNIASMAPTTALQFGINGIFKKILPEHPMKPMVSAFGAGICSAVVSSPIELLILHVQNEEKRRIATGNTQPTLSTRQILRGLIDYGGYRALVRGMLPKGLRDAGFATGLLSAHEKIKERLQQAAGNGLAATLGAGVLTGLGVTMITHPFDTISTVMQDSCNVASYVPRKEQITTMLQAGRIIYQQGKLRGFYKGVVPRFAFVTLATGVMDQVRESLNEYTDRLMEDCEVT